MKIGDDVYNNHFRHMILSGYLCGLFHPIEYVENYSRGIGEKYTDLQEIEHFCYFAIKEFYSIDHNCEPEEVTVQMVKDWTEEFYNHNKNIE